MGDFATRVVVPTGSTLGRDQVRWVVDVTDHVVLLCVQLDVELLEFTGSHELIDDVTDSLHPLLRVSDLMLLQILHLARIAGEIVRETRITATFGREK